MAMRLALVISSNYSENNVVPVRNAFEDTAALVEARLSRDDTEFSTVALKANRDLPEQLDELLEAYLGSLECLLVHFSGYLAVKPDRGPALLLDGGRLRAFPVSRLRAALGQAAQLTFAIMDVVAVMDGNVELEHIAASLGRALHDTTPHVSVLSSVALPEQIDLNRRGCSRLTDLWLLSLEDQARNARDALVFSGPVVRGLQSERIAFSSLPSFDYQPSDQDFVIVPGPKVGGFPEEVSALKRATQRSLGVRPPGVETDPSSLVDSSVPADSNGSNSGDTWVDARHSTEVTDDEIFEDEDMPTTPPTIGHRPAVAEVRIPVPPPLGSSTLGPPVASASAAWVGQAAYFPSVPPPTVFPKLPTPPSTALPKLPTPPPTAFPQIPSPPPLPLRSQQGTLPGIEEPPEDFLDRNPRHVPSLQALSDFAQSQQDLDTAALASAVIICLESGRPEDEARSAGLVTDGLPLAQRTLNDQDFEEILLAKLADVSMLRTLGKLTQVAKEAGLASDSGSESLPKDATVLDPVLSTATLARSLAWAAKFVGVDTPELVVLPELPTHLELAVTEGARLLISKQLGTGLNLSQWAFLGSRHLTMLRPELIWRAALDTPERLMSVIGYCVRYAQQGGDFIKSVDESERKVAKRFLAQLETDDLLAGQVTQVFCDIIADRAEWATIATQYLNAADRVLLRGGLLACANPAAAWQLTQQYPLKSLLSVEEQLDEIARFAISDGHLALRKSLGLALSVPEVAS